MSSIKLETPRLILRGWKASDREPFARLNADPRVMRYFPATLSRAESDEVADRIQQGIEQRGWGFYAAELHETAEFIGFIGLSIPNFEAHFTPCVEIGWRLAAAHWNRGLATEGAREAAAHAFRNLGISEIVAFTAVSNAPSRRVMEKIGMSYDPAGDFDHPRIGEGHPLRRHVLYRLRK